MNKLATRIKNVGPMQSMAARLGIVSGMGLGEALREKFTSQGARILISILVIAAVFIGNIAYETGNLTGSILGIQAAFPAADNQTVKIVLALVLGVIAFALLTRCADGRYFPDLRICCKARLGRSFCRPLRIQGSGRRRLDDSRGSDGNHGRTV